MSSKSKLKQPTFKTVSANDDIKYKRKYKELKKKIREMEEENEKLSLKLTRAKKNIQRLRIERSFLFDRLEQSQPTNDSDSDTTSTPPRVIDTEEEISSSAEEDQRSGKRKKQNRDPNAPKRPRNAFLMYCKLQRDQAREENQNKGFQDVTRILSQKWKDLPNEEKQIYYDMYNEAKQAYEKEMSSYVGSSVQSPGYQQEGIQNGVTTYLEEENNVTDQHYYDDDSGEAITTETLRLAATTLESPYNNNHEGEKGIGSELEEEKVNIKSDVGDDDFESDSGSEMVDELQPDPADTAGVNYSKRRHSRAEREEAMKYDEDVRMEDESEKKENEVEAADSEEDNIVNETEDGNASENDEF